MNCSSLKARLPAVMLLVSVVASLGFNPASTAVEKVREGIRYFVDGEFESADKSFVEADKAEPENATIAFDRACALAAAGDPEKVEEARTLFRNAALARDVGLAGRAHYNLGTLAAEQGRATLGENPVEAAPEKREEGVSQLLAAVGHYRDCLKLDRDHANARHNLELIRLFIKHIQDQWEKRDREKAREEKGLLEFLAMIEQRQTELRSAVSVLSDEQNSPQRRQAAAELSDSQMELRDEIEPLKAKIAEEIAAAQQASGGNGAAQDPGRSSQMAQAQALLQKIGDEAGSKMEAAASEIRDAAFDDARTSQLETLDRLNEIYMALAPFTNVLQRAIKQQEQLTGSSETLTGFDEQPAGQRPSDAGASAGTENEKEVLEPVEILISDNEYSELAQQQSRVKDWSRMLSLKAQAELPQVDAQLQAAQAQSEAEAEAGDGGTAPAPTKDDGSRDDEGSADPNAKSAAEDALAQLERMKASLEKAIELAPKAEEHARAAADSLEIAELLKALPDQQQALKLLREIAEPLKKDDQQQGDDQQNQDQKNQDQKNDDGDKGDQNQQSQNDQQQNKSDQQNQQDQQQKGRSQRERAMSALRRAREREREHRDLQKQLQQLIGGRIPVDRDW
jgi:hypothetical protein